MFMGLGQVLNETQESQIILSTLRERLWCSADQANWRKPREGIDEMT